MRIYRCDKCGGDFTRDDDLLTIKADWNAKFGGLRMELCEACFKALLNWSKNK